MTILKLLVGTVLVIFLLSFVIQILAFLGAALIATVVAVGEKFDI